MSADTGKDAAAEVFSRIVDSSQPRSLLCCGETAEAVGQRWCRSRPDTRLLLLDRQAPFEDLPGAGVQDLALISETLEDLPHEDGEHLLGLLRNYGTLRIAVLVGPAPRWRFTDFIGLGFRRHARLDTDSGPMTLFSYNLDNYNHEREWNNPKNWANPEMWDKARW